MTAVVKSRLERALKLNGQQAGLDFAWGKKLGNQMILKALKLKAGDIKIPVLEKDITLIKQSCKEISSPEKISAQWELDSFLNLPPKVLSKLATDAASGLGLDAKILQVTANFNKLMLQGPGSCSITQEHKDDASGLFGRLILQVPVAYGYEGGVLEVKHRHQTQYFNCSPHSQAQFYLTVLYSDCNNIMNPVTSGYRLVLLFDLVWKNPTLLEDFKHPVSTKVMREVRESLAPWGIARQDSDWDLLVIPTDHRYIPFQLSFDRLKGKDRLVAQALRSLHFLEIHLVSAINADRTSAIDQQNPISSIGETEGGRETPEDVPGVLLEDWTEMNNQRVRFPGLQLNIGTEIVGADAPDTAFVIWPKWQRMSIICRSGIDNALDEMESAMGNEATSPKLLQEYLERIMNFCFKSPAAAWSRNCGKRSSRLLNLCHNMKAFQEAHRLIQWLSSDSQHFLGIPSEEAAVAWASIIGSIGWVTVEKEVLAMLIPPNVDQMGSFARLAIQLWEDGLTQPSLAIAGRITNLLAQIDNLESMDISALSACFHTVVRLEQCNETSDSQRLSSFVAKIATLETQIIALVLVDFRGTFGDEIKKIPTAVEHLIKLCFQVADDILSAGDDADDLAIQMLSVCVWLDDAEMLEDFLSRIGRLGRDNPLNRAICGDSSQLCPDREVLTKFLADRSADFGAIKETEFQLIFEALTAAMNSPPTAKRSRKDLI